MAEGGETGERGDLGMSVEQEGGVSQGGVSHSPRFRARDSSSRVRDSDSLGILESCSIGPKQRRFSARFKTWRED